MAYDKKQLRTFKELVKLSNTPRYMKGVSYNRFTGRILARFGRLYVTNGYSLIMVEYPEFSDFGQDEWCEVTKYVDVNGNMIKPELKPCERQYSNTIFEQLFIEPGDYKQVCDLPVNAHLLRDVLNVFQINDLTPIIANDGLRYELSAHNNDVSIKAAVIGYRR